jgi:hypothetical protein
MASAAGGPVAALTLSQVQTGTFVGGCAPVTVTTTDSTGGPTAGTVSIVLSQPTSSANPQPAFCAPGSGSNPVTVTGTAGASGGNATSTGSLTTNATTGKATFGVTSSQAGTVTVNATSNGHAAAAKTVNVEAAQQVGNANVKSLVASPKTQTITFGSSATVTSTALDNLGAPVSGAQEQYQITGTDATGSGANLAGGPTGTNGVATLTYTPSNIGSDNITFFVNPAGASATNGTPTGVETTASVRIVGAGTPTDTITVTAPAGTVGHPDTITAVVTDGQGNPVAGDSLTFQVTGADDVSGTGANTDANGSTSFTFTPGKNGTDQVLVTDTTTSTPGNPNGNQNVSKSFSVGGTSTGTSNGKATENPHLNCFSHAKHQVHCTVSTHPAKKGLTVVLRKVESSGNTRIVATNNGTGTKGKAGFSLNGFKRGVHEHYVAHVRASSTTKSADSNHDGVHVK